MTTMATIITDLKTGNTESLYLATDTQIEKLLAANKISEEYVNMFYENQDEMRELMAAAIEEFTPAVSLADAAINSLKKAPSKDPVLIPADQMELDALNESRADQTKRRELMASDAIANAETTISGKEIAMIFDNTYKFNWTLRRDGKGVSDLELTASDLALLKADFKAFKTSFENAGAENFDQRISYLKKLSLHTLYKGEPKNSEEVLETEAEADTETELENAYEQALTAALAFAKEMGKSEDVIKMLESLQSEQGMQTVESVSH